MADDRKCNQGQVVPLEEGVLMFLDKQGRNIATYDSKVEGSLQRTYELLLVAYEGETIEHGTYHRWLGSLQRKGLKLSDEEKQELRERRVRIRRLRAS